MFLIGILFYLISLLLCHKTPLDDYVFNDEDIDFTKWHLVNSSIMKLYSKYALKTTTLKWYDASFSNNSIWMHDLYITVPNNFKRNNTIFYYIDSSNSDDFDDKKVTRLSLKCNCITATIRQIPNQPIQFTNDLTNKSRIEDEIIAWTMKIYLTNERLKCVNKTYEQVPLLFPMTKSAKRGIDLTVDFLKSKNYNFLEKFVVSGKSKRGWTAWLLTAVDPRVIAQVPIVFDLINWNLNIHDQFMSLGGNYTFALEDYFNQNLTNYVDSLEFYDLRLLIDPFMYLNRYRDKSIMMILSTSDEYMMPVNSRYFSKELSIITEYRSYMRRYPNTSHDLTGLDKSYFKSILSFLHLVNNEKEWPKYAWEFGNNKTHGYIRVKLSHLNLFNSFEILGYYAMGRNNLRDLRKFEFKTKKTNEEIVWKKNSIAKNKNLTSKIYEYEFTIEKNSSLDKYTAFYVDACLNFKQSSKKFVVSTDVNFIPEYYPITDFTSNQFF